MLETVNLDERLKKEKLKVLLDESLGNALGQVQRDARNAGLPVIILFEGWRHSRRSEILGKMMQYMDARGFRVFSSAKLDKRSRQMPFFAAYWLLLPAPGDMAVYRHSWYYQKNESEVDEDYEGTKTTFEHINKFEKMLTDGHYCLLKFFVHVSEKQQIENKKKAAKSLGKAWEPFSDIYSEEGNYKEFYRRYDEMLAATDTLNAPWHVINGEDLDVAEYQVFTTIVEELGKAVADYTESKKHPQPSTNISDSNKKFDILKTIDLSKSVTKEEYKKKLKEYQSRLKVLQVEAFRKHVSTILAFEGWDAAGKGGTIRRVTAALDPMGFAVHPYSAPNVVERMYHYLWRFWINYPEPGSIALFDRTWYGRVMVERIEKLTPDVDWRRAYDEINETERQWSEANTVIAKFWLQIDQDEQARRFKDREDNPEKVWKITDEDWRNRAKWPQYEDAVNEMLGRTNTPWAPWIVVEAEDKLYARLKVLKTVVDMLEAKLQEK
ncbi:MAG: Polyphosphate:AMP phosphotransferase [Succiniclasticum sp.]|jgi:AMP-polyphosphate phosphotransferase